MVFDSMSGFVRRHAARPQPVSLLAFAVWLLFTSATPGWAADFYITDTSLDVADDGKCTLPEALIGLSNPLNYSPGECPGATALSGVSSTPDVIHLPPGAVFDFTTPLEYWSTGDSALPAVTRSLTIEGNGAVLQRSTVGCIPDFRILRVRIDGCSGCTFPTGAPVVFRNLTFRNGSATPQSQVGGGLYIELSLTPVILEDVRFEDNRGAIGGGLFGGGLDTNSLANPGTILRRVTFERNEATFLSGGFDVGGNIIAEDLVVRDNINGGGRLRGTVALRRATFDGNVGGALEVEQGSGWPTTQSLVEDSTFTRNTGSNAGVAIRAVGKVLVRNSTITLNTSTNRFGMVATGTLAAVPEATPPPTPPFDPMLVLRNVTIVDNVGGGVLNPGARVGPVGSITEARSAGVLYSNSIIAGNTPSLIPGTDCMQGVLGVPFISEGHNIISDGNQCNATASGDQVIPGATGATLALAALGPTGGLTETRRPLAGSPALDAGDPAAPGSGGTACELRDQRGVARNLDTPCDIGAHEVVAAPTGIVRAVKSVRLVTDTNGDWIPGAGDRLRYTVVIANRGETTATAVTFSDTPGAGSTLVAGAVTTSQGSVTSSVGSVGVNLGNLAFGATATITFDVTINAPLLGTQTQVCNQGAVAGGNIAGLTTVDPTGAAQTCIATSAKPFRVTKTASVAGGSVNGGETISYTLTVTNVSAAAAEIFIRDKMDLAVIANCPSLSAPGATSAICTPGNPGEIQLYYASLGAGASATVTYTATALNPLPPGDRFICNWVAWFPPSSSQEQAGDNPATLLPDDRTCLPTAAAPPAVVFTKRDNLATDVDGDGRADVGDVIRYVVTITNPTGFALADAIFSDQIDPVGGTFGTGLGLLCGMGVTVAPATGNAPVCTADTLYIDAIGIPAGGTVTITFFAEPKANSRQGCNQAVFFDYVRDLPFGLGPVHQLSNDPDTAKAGDMTCTPLSGATVLRATKEGLLFNDVNNDGQLNPGDRIQYEVELDSQGVEGIFNAVYNDTVDITLGNLDCASVTTGGAVLAAPVSCNSATGALQVQFAQLCGLAVIRYEVVLRNPVPAIGTQICNQGQAAGTNQPMVLTDDPTTISTPNDPTCLPLVASPNVTATMVDAVAVDVAPLGQANPGDTLQYTVVVSNTGNRSTPVVFTAGVPLHTTLVAGSVTTTAGTITNGSPPGPVIVDLGTLVPGAGSVTITFRVLINAAVPAGTTQISAQGSLFNANPVVNVLTDDPAAGGVQDPTITPLVTTPALTATMADSIAVNSPPASGVADPGDVIRYLVVLDATGTIDTTAVTFASGVAVNSTLQVGSVTTSRGTVTTGNTAGDTTVAVNVGTIAATFADQVIIQFEARVNLPLPSGVTQLSLQGTASATGVAAFGTNDPDTVAANDPTITPLAADPLVVVTKRDTLQVDLNGDGVAAPGDTLRYTITFTNSGEQNAGNTVFTDTPDPNTPLVVGSVTTTLGAVTTGNTAGDTSVVVALGSLPGTDGVTPGTATVTFDVLIDDPLPLGVAEIANQGNTTNVDGPAVVTDDPDTPALLDPTRTTIGPAVSATLVDAVFVAGDLDSDGLSDEGDTLEYTVVVRNTGGTAANGVSLTLPAVANTSHVVGAVTTTAGTVTTGNGAGDTTVGVSIGTLASGGGMATITYRVLIDNPVPLAVSQLSNQGTVSGSNFTSLSTDDPAAGGTADPTVTVLDFDPELSATKADLLTDLNANGLADPGETITYTLVLTNASRESATTVIFTDAPDANTTLTVGSVTSSQGTITSGNTAGNTTVAVAVGSVTGPTSGGPGVPVTISFAVTVVASPSAGALQVANQGSFTGTNFVALPTDDPATGPLSDPTVTLLGPFFTVSLADGLAVDGDSDTAADEGDTVLYTTTITHVAGQPATAVTYTGPAVADTTHVVGSVTTSAGTVSTGNTAGDTSVAIAIGATSVGNVVTVTYHALIDDPVPLTTSQLSHQATLAGGNFSNVSSDDPVAAGSSDPTITVLDFDATLTATKADLLTDLNGNGLADPGETITYTVVLTNDSRDPATTVLFTDSPDANTTLTVGSVTSSQGTVNLGNTAGDTTVEVAVGAVTGPSSGGPGVPVTISFAVTVVATPSAGALQVANQGTFTGDNFAAVLTDDPATAAVSDPTITLLGPFFSVSLVDSLAVDGDSDTAADEGDTVLYTATITQVAGQPAAAVSYTGPAVTDTAHVVGSVTTTAGSVSIGNTAGDTAVAVTIGATSVGNVVTVTYQALIGDPVPLTTSQLSHQATLAGGNFSNVSSDDPAAGGSSDPTITVLDFDATLTATKADLLTDLNGNGLADPGETITYTVVLTNDSRDPATTVLFTDSPDANTTLTVGSVTSSQGTVNLGNTAGDTTVEVAVGAVTGPSSGGPGVPVTISFAVTVVATPSPGALQVANQGTFTGANFAAVSTDDPMTAPVNDPTLTPLAPTFTLSLSDSLAIDVDGDTAADEGDTVLYTATITQVAGQPAAAVTYTGPAVTDTAHVVGSVTTTAGSVSTGNTAGDTSVAVAIGATSAGNVVTVTYQALIDDPVPLTTSQLSHQATLAGGNFSNVSSDDPAAAGTADPTLTPLDFDPRLTGTKTDTLTGDVDGNGFADPGDTLTYTVVLTNASRQPATALTFTDTPDPNTSLVVGTVTTTQGAVTTGNTAGDTTVAVALGDLIGPSLGGPGAPVTISFAATIGTSLPGAVTQVANQGTVNGSNITALPTDDPATPAVIGDPTITSVRRVPVLQTTMSDGLAVDLDTDGLPDEGDTLEYTVSLSNTGTADAQALAFALTPSAHTSLVVGSVTTTQGTVVTGNTAGNTTVAVNLGILPVGPTATVRFRLVIADPVPLAVTQVSAQGTVTADNAPAQPTDDPATVAPADPTVTGLDFDPLLTVTKVDVVDPDLNGNGTLQLGDGLLYTVTVTNSGREDALAITLNDTPGTGSNLVVGSVVASQGAVTLGNTAGDTNVAVDLGTLPANGGSATVTFRVDIPPPSGPVSEVANQATLTGSNVATQVSDDPDTAAPNDPTVTRFGRSVVEIPTLDGLALALLVLMLGLLAMRRVRT